jgi:hypothetical protein
MVGADASDATDFMMGQPVVRTLLAEVDEPTIAAAPAALREALARYETPSGVVLASAAWLVRAWRG